MILTIKQKEILDSFTKLLIEKLKNKTTGPPTTFGFEIEFLPNKPVDLKQMDRLYSLLPKIGFKKKSGCFISNTGLFITFEPGGQIEYCSPPLCNGDFDLFDRITGQITQTNIKIFDNLNIQYIATGFLPNRQDTPLCLQTERYHNLHERVAFSGTRGREMMKATASIHLHVGFRSMDDIPVIYKTLCNLAHSDEFSMSKERKDIWQNTDPSRCTMPEIDLNEINDTKSLLKQIVHHALCAVDLAKNIPACMIDDIAFDYFLTHLTTIFTDVRLNLKGPTLELRTLDSMPIPEMAKKWKSFTSILTKALN